MVVRVPLLQFVTFWYEVLLCLILPHLCCVHKFSFLRPAVLLFWSSVVEYYIAVCEDRGWVSTWWLWATLRCKVWERVFFSNWVFKRRNCVFNFLGKQARELKELDLLAYNTASPEIRAELWAWVVVRCLDLLDRFGVETLMVRRSKKAYPCFIPFDKGTSCGAPSLSTN